MEYYCIMVVTGVEKSFKKAAEDALKGDFPDARFFFFERTLCRNNGEKFDAPLFPGYVFFQVGELSPAFFLALRKIPGFLRILRDNRDPTRILGIQLDELQSFIQKGERWGFSKLEFLPGKKIKVISGPLLGLEGQILMVNKKKRRITVQSSLFPDKRFDLMYELAEILRPE